MELSSFKRGYLNAEEKNFYMVCKTLIKMINGESNLDGSITKEVWVEWKKRGMLTDEMQKDIKYVKSYLMKFCDEIEENIDETERNKLDKQLEKFAFRIVDDYTLRKIYRDYKDNKYFVMERRKFDPILQEIAEVRCVGCKDDYRKCSLYNAFEDINLPRVEEESNCPYAADLSMCRSEEVERIEKIKDHLKVKNQFRK
jgi:hypothetical protein